MSLLLIRHERPDVTAPHAPKFVPMRVTQDNAIRQTHAAGFSGECSRDSVIRVEQHEAFRANFLRYGGWRGRAWRGREREGLRRGLRENRRGRNEAGEHATGEPGNKRE